MQRIGIDLGGTKIEGVVLDAGGHELTRLRVPTPAGDYPATLDAVSQLITQLNDFCEGTRVSVGICTPGTPSRKTGLMKNCNSICLNGQSFQADLEQRLGYSVHLSNDANCLALSEWHDGAAAGGQIVFAVILGTGVGGGLLANGSLVEGAGGVGGEWGHIPLPWPSEQEQPGPQCYCGKHGCMETWCSGPALSRDHAAHTGVQLRPEQITDAMRQGDSTAEASVNRWMDRLARGIASVCNIVDPDVIVFGGGLSSIDMIYDQLPSRLLDYVFSDDVPANIVPAKHGAASGVRGAARLSSE
ncbi:MAG: ROK family protein [Phycisphaerales bacterium]|nr:ROK family protein [Phycisphaerales bacterium]